MKLGGTRLLADKIIEQYKLLQQACTRCAIFKIKTRLIVA